MADRLGQLGDPREAPASAREDPAAASGEGRPARVLEQVLVEPEDPAAQDVERVVGQLDREPAIAHRREDRLDVGEEAGPAVPRSSRTRRAQGWRSITRRAAIACSRRAGFQSSPGGGSLDLADDTSTMPSSRSSLFRTWR